MKYATSRDKNNFKCNFTIDKASTIRVTSNQRTQYCIGKIKIWRTS